MHTRRPHRDANFIWLLAAAAFCLTESYRTPLYGQSPTLMQGSLGETSEPAMSLFILNLPAGRSAAAHAHEGAVFAYVLEGEIENQIEPEPLKIHHAGDFFHEHPRQMHRVFRNVSNTEAKILVFQNTAKLPAGVKPLLQQPLVELGGREVSVVKITTAPAGTTRAHQHPGQIFAYLVKGEVESQVDPDPPKVYRAGDVFYEPPMHVHRSYRNLSGTEPAELLVFYVSKAGDPLAVRVNQ